MRVLKYIIILLLLVSASDQARAKECVIFLHGLARTEKSMVNIESFLMEQGYHTVNLGYPSTKYKIEKLAEKAVEKALFCCQGSEKVHFVTHSLGGILLREYLTRHEIANLGRVVMLGPPNKGSQVVDKLKDIPGFELIHGPAGMQLGTGKLSIPNKLGPADFELGIVAGTKSINLILSSLLPDMDDGKVSVENTKLEGMSDHISLPVTHPLMMNNKQVMKQVVYFIKNGEFEKSVK